MGDECRRACHEAIHNIPQRLAVRPWLTHGYGIVLVHMTLLLMSGCVGASHTLKRHCALDDEVLADLKIARIDAQPLARDTQGSLSSGWVTLRRRPPPRCRPPSLLSRRLGGPRKPLPLPLT